MQAVGETVFDALYLSFVTAIGVAMLLKGNSPLVKKFGTMAVLLGVGDAFHLVPRCYALWTTGLEANAAALGIGKFITSITMTVFYLILYGIWRDYYKIQGRRSMDRAVWALSALRIGLCLLPQNRWTVYQPPLAFGILRNVPFMAMGVLLIVLFAQEAKRTGGDGFRHMPAAITLSFGFYLPVVLLSGAVPAIGMLMIPKTLAYIWIVLMGWQICRGEKNASPDVS